MYMSELGLCVLLTTLGALLFALQLTFENRTHGDLQLLQIGAIVDLSPAVLMRRRTVVVSPCPAPDPPLPWHARLMFPWKRELPRARAGVEYVVRCSVLCLYADGDVSLSHDGENYVTVVAGETALLVPRHHRYVCSRDAPRSAYYSTPSLLLYINQN